MMATAKRKDGPIESAGAVVFFIGKERRGTAKGVSDEAQ